MRIGDGAGRRGRRNPTAGGEAPPAPAFAGRPAAGGRPALLLAVVLPLVLAASAAFTYACGQRGLFPLDQSILFDGGWRVLSGQVPFRDFVAPVGPVSFWLQGGLFALFGVSWHGYLASAALLDAVAALLAFAVARCLLAGETAAPLLAAAITGAWFLPPSGTPWLDAVAFLPALAALWALLRAAGAAGRGLMAERPGGAPQGRADGRAGDGPAGSRGPVTGGAVAWGALAGLLLAATFLAKQSVALAVAPAVLVALSPGRRRGRLLAALAAGLAAGGLLFAGWLLAAAEPALFVRHVLEIPAGEGWQRLAQRPARRLLTLATGAGPRLLRIPLLLAVLPAAARLLRRAGTGAEEGRRAALVAVALFLGQNLFLATANNQPAISLPFAGLVVALGARIAWGRMGRGLAVLLAALVLAAAVPVAWGRGVHESVPAAARFPHRLEVEGLGALRWAEPTLLRCVSCRAERPGAPAARVVPVEAEQVEALVRRLRRDGDPFFVFPDWTLLYGVVGSPSPQPLLWFHPGLTHPPQGDPDLDRWIVRDLERHGVATVVVEEVSWFGTARRLARFPRLAAWMERCFAEDERIGPFRVLRRRAACRPSPGDAGERSWEPAERRPPASP